MTNEGNDLYRTGLFNASITGLAQPVFTAQSACNYVLNYARDCKRVTDGDALVILQEAERLEKAAAILRKAAAFAKPMPRPAFLQAAE